MNTYVHLPAEIVAEIFSYLPPASATSPTQATLYSACLVSRLWYKEAITALYAHPYVHGGNFEAFARTLCPSKNLHVRQSGAGALVRTLDLSRLVYHSRRSLTARLLGRVRENLESFTAPQASFAINCFPALSKCQKLRALDLALVSESLSLKCLSHTLSALPSLELVSFPRSAYHDTEQVVWPPKLRELRLSGGINNDFLECIVAGELSTTLPETLRAFTIRHCPRVTTSALLKLLRALGPQLKSLYISHMPALRNTALDTIPYICPHLEDLSVSADYITDDFLDYPILERGEHGEVRQLFETPGSLPPPEEFLEKGSLPLRTLEITDSGLPNEDTPDPVEFFFAVTEGMFRRLSKLRVAKSLSWQVIGVDDEGTTEELDETLTANAAAAGEDVKKAGLWMFGQC